VANQALSTTNMPYPRVATEVGMFEVIYGEASGAMRPFKGRLAQDQILKVIGDARSLNVQ
jgi:cytochrome c-L